MRRPARAIDAVLDPIIDQLPTRRPGMGRRTQVVELMKVKRPERALAFVVPVDLVAEVMSAMNQFETARPVESRMGGGRQKRNTRRRHATRRRRDRTFFRLLATAEDMENLSRELMRTHVAHGPQNLAELRKPHGLSSSLSANNFA